MATVVTLTTDTPDFQVPDTRSTDPVSVFGTPDDNRVKTGNGDDTIRGNAGDDTINAGQGFNVISSGAGDDYVRVATNASGSVNTGSGNDRVDVGSSTGDLRVNTGSGDDLINVVKSADSVTIGAGAGNDRINIASPNFIKVDAGAGNDIIRLNNTDASPDSTGGSINGGRGFDIIRSSADGLSLTIASNQNSPARVSGIEAVVGSKATSQSVAVSLATVSSTGDTAGLGGNTANGKAFVALLGGNGLDTLIVSVDGVGINTQNNGLGKWQFVGDAASHAAVATTLGADATASLASAGASGRDIAALKGFVYGLASGGGITKYVTIWTDLSTTDGVTYG